MSVGHLQACRAFVVIACLGCLRRCRVLVFSNWTEDLLARVGCTSRPRWRCTFRSHVMHRRSCSRRGPAAPREMPSRRDAAATTAGGRNARGSRLQTVGRTAAVLRALIAHRAGLTLSELAAVIGLPVSSLHRLVVALDEEGLVRAQPRGRIFLGPLITQMAAEGAATLAGEVRDAVRALASSVNETVDVAVLDGDALRFVAQTPGAGRLRAVSCVGVRFPLHCTGSGKAFLARMGRQQASALLPTRLPALTAHTLTSRRALWRELDEVRSTGVGFDREEHHLGIASLAAVVTDSRGTDIAISVVAPAVRFYDRERQLADGVLAAVAIVERRANSARRKSASM